MVYLGIFREDEKIFPYANFPNAITAIPPITPTTNILFIRISYFILYQLWVNI
jgi:hypothetical protein